MYTSSPDNLQQWENSAEGACEEPMVTRRLLLRAGAGGLMLTASGVLLPDWRQEAEAREGALGGDKGGRRGKDRRGRNNKRHHGDKKKNGNNDAPRGGGPLFRSSALTVVNQGIHTLNCTFFYRTKTGLDDYGLPIANGTRTISEDQRYRYDSDHYRVGVLIKQAPIVNTDLYADVRNLSFWFPRGSVTKGSNLDPAAGNFGTDFFQEQEFDTGEKRQEFNVILQRMKDDSQGARRIEWELIIK